MKGRSTAEVVALIAWLSVGAAFRTAEGRVWHVYPDSALHSIQAALDSCNNDDTVRVAPGVYNERIVWPQTIGIVLVSDSGPELTAVWNTTTSVVTMPYGLARNTVLDGFTIGGGRTTNGAGINCSSCSPPIQNCIVTENWASGCGGGVYCNSASPTMYNNVISYNVADNGAGICCFASSHPLVRANTIRKNSAVSDGGGIYCWVSDPRIESNDIDSNFGHQGAGVFCLMSQPTIYNNNIFGHDSLYGVYNGTSSLSDTVDARFNWWGDSTGPWNPTLNPNGRGDWVSDKVKFDSWLRQPMSGIAERELQPGSAWPSELSLWPNPCRGILRVRMQPITKLRPQELRVRDVSGRMVKRCELAACARADVDLRALPDGVYFVHLSDCPNGGQKVVLTR